MLTNLLIFSIICIANAFYIVAFNRWCQYDTHEGVTYSSQESKRGQIREETKMIFWWIRFYGDKYFSNFWKKPVYDCCTCMASLHGILPFLFTARSIGMEYGAGMLLMGLFYIGTLSGVATFINER